VGEYSKDEVRGIAASLGLRTADKPESQEICFVPEGDVHSYLQEMVPSGSRPGPVITSLGERVGTHRGFAHYTVGQRKGLGVSVGIPLYVKEVRPKDNAVVVDTGERIGAAGLLVEDVSFVSGGKPDSFEATVMTRYRGPETAAKIFRTESGAYQVAYEEPAGPTAPGQAAVFYQGEEVVGGGTIAIVQRADPSNRPVG
jgi:tRNA-specific 2-thiouridylase